MIAQNISKLEPVVDLFQKSRTKFIETLREKATLDEEGKPIVSDELSAEFTAEIETLLNEDQKVRLKKVTLIDDGQLSIEPGILLAAMDYLIVKDNGDKAS